MAFVFRSSKKTIFQIEPTTQINQLPQSIAQNQSNNNRKFLTSTNVRKGLPCNKQNELKFLPKEQLYVNQLPKFQGSTIHKHSSLFTAKQTFYLNQFGTNQASSHKENNGNLQDFLFIRQIEQKDKDIMNIKILYQNQNKKRQTMQNKPAKELKYKQQKAKQQPAIINNSLLKASLSKTAQSIHLNYQKLQLFDPKSSQKLATTSKIYKFNQLKKLSPLRYNINDQPTQQINRAEILFIQNSQNKGNQIKSQKQSKNVVSNKVKQIQLSYKQKECIQQQSDQQYDCKATPGPGAYNYDNCNTKKIFRSKKEKFNKIFFSPLQRFSNDAKFQEVTYIKDQQQSQIFNKVNKNNCPSFLSKSPRFTRSQSNLYPPPGYYETRQTLQHDLIRNILKSSNSTAFISYEPRIPHKKNSQQLPGPGFYNPDFILEKIYQEHGRSSYIYKSTLPRNLHNQIKTSQKSKGNLNPLVSMNSKDKINPIHVQQESMFLTNYSVQYPPFLSCSQRFQTLLKPINMQKVGSKLSQIEQVKKDEWKQPFNTSSKRQMSVNLGEGVGIGLYNYASKQNWTKKSYNVLFS